MCKKYRDTHKTERKLYYEENKELILKKQKEYYKKNWCRIKIIKKNYYIINKDRLYAKAKIKNKLWIQNNPEKQREYYHKRHRFGFKPINDYSEGCEAHHVHLENRTDFIIYMPNFLHNLHYHNSNRKNTMITVNALALDYWVNQDMYNGLYYED